MAITLTDSAVRRVQSYLAKRGGMGLRLGVKSTGCSGFSYVVDYADQAGPEDVIFDAAGVKVVVSRAHLPLLDGTRVDCVRKGLNETFEFDNPNAKEACGCGDSFTV
ncbi:MAG: HesB/IscA family protein [Gammaproteobacteria bacterium]